MFSKLYLDHLISPSRWTRKSQGGARVVEHINFIDNQSKIVTESIPCELNIPYGPRPREVIHIYGTDLPENSPIFIFVHGGYWQEPLIKHNSNTFIAKHLHSNNVKSIFVGYELCPNVTLPELIQNVEKAVKLCLEYAKKHRSRGIHLSGHSAGGHIVAMLFKTFISSLPKEDQSLFKSAFLLAGVFDIVPVLPTTLNDQMKLDETSAVELSPLRQQLTSGDCELIVVVAKYDCPRLIQQGEDMYKHAKKLGLKTEFVFMEDMDHFDVVEGLYEEENELTKLIVRYCTMK